MKHAASKIAMACLFLATASICTASAANTDTGSRVKPHNEAQMEYTIPISFKDRHISTYNIHFLKYDKQIRHFDLYRGVTITRGKGSLIEDGQEYNTRGWGAGYTYMLRKKKDLNDHLALALDASGGLILYNKAFPETGRAYNFMWRIGPRLIYAPSATTSIALGWTMMHVSNGMRNHNPGYNGGGITIGIGHQF